MRAIVLERPHHAVVVAPQGDPVTEAAYLFDLAFGQQVRRKHRIPTVSDTVLEQLLHRLAFSDSCHAGPFRRLVVARDCSTAEFGHKSGEVLAGPWTTCGVRWTLRDEVCDNTVEVMDASCIGRFDGVAKTVLEVAGGRSFRLMWF
jgi:hypothetical protein